MWNKPTIKQLQRIPNLYSQEDKDDPKVYMKFFLGSFTWYIIEIDHKNLDTMFGLVVSQETPKGELGYISLKELMSIRSRGIEVDRDLHQVSTIKPKLLSTLLKEDGVR